MNLQHIYELDTAHWWDDRDGPMAPLHWMTPARFAYFAEVAGPLQGKAVLDLGCGGGLLAERLADAGAQVVGIDHLHACVRAAREHAAQTGKSIAYLQMKAERLAFADHSFDVVVAADVLEHIPDLSAVLVEVSRVLRPGGVFAFDTVNRTWLARFVIVWLAERVLHLVPQGTHDPSLFLRPAELAARLAAVGLHFGTAVGLGPVGYWGRRIRFGRLPVTLLSYMGCARKAIKGS
jgi:2-polyprenyl-6-hydroxyphenyl methylase/3-demethylubiquinone-9 3-methyltransferase